MTSVVKGVLYVIILPLLCFLSVCGLVLRILICPLPLFCLGSCFKDTAYFLIGVPKKVYNTLILDESFDAEILISEDN